MIPKGTMLSLWNKLTTNEAKAPKIIFILPIKADALPARFVKGVRDNAVVLGFWKPNRNKIRNIRITII